MQNTFVKTDFKFQTFQILNIVFDDTDLVSMHIKHKQDNQWKETSLLFTFKMFNDLLRFSGRTGEYLQLKVSDLLIYSKMTPYVITLHNEICIVSSCYIEVSNVIENDDSVFAVENIMPVPYLQQIKNLRKNMQDYKQIKLGADTIAKNTLQHIADKYEYFNSLLALNVSESYARAQAGLSNDYLFKLAFLAAQTQ